MHFICWILWAGWTWNDNIFAVNNSSTRFCSFNQRMKICKAWVCGKAFSVKCVDIKSLKEHRWLLHRSTMVFQPIVCCLHAYFLKRSYLHLGGTSCPWRLPILLVIVCEVNHWILLYRNCSCFTYFSSRSRHRSFVFFKGTSLWKNCRWFCRQNLIRVLVFNGAYRLDWLVSSSSIQFTCLSWNLSFATFLVLVFIRVISRSFTFWNFCLLFGKRALCRSHIMSHKTVLSWRLVWCWLRFACLKARKMLLHRFQLLNCSFILVLLIT